MEVQSKRKVEPTKVSTEKLTARPRILVVEDDITSEPIWDHILARVDDRAVMVWATSVNEADQLIQDAMKEGKPFALIICDIFLSGSLTGIDLWQRFRDQMRTPIILMSSIDHMKLQKHLRGIGEPVYLPKPLNMHDTIETVYEMLHHPQA